MYLRAAGKGGMAWWLGGRLAGWVVHHMQQLVVLGTVQLHRRGQPATTGMASVRNLGCHECTSCGLAARYRISARCMLQTVSDAAWPVPLHHALHHGLLCFCCIACSPCLVSPDSVELDTTQDGAHHEGAHQRRLWLDKHLLHLLACSRGSRGHDQTRCMLHLWCPCWDHRLLHC